MFNFNIRTKKLELLKSLPLSFEVYEALRLVATVLHIGVQRFSDFPRHLVHNDAVVLTFAGLFLCLNNGSETPNLVLEFLPSILLKLELTRQEVQLELQLAASIGELNTDRVAGQ